MRAVEKTGHSLFLRCRRHRGADDCDDEYSGENEVVQRRNR